MFVEITQINEWKLLHCHCCAYNCFPVVYSHKLKYVDIEFELGTETEQR